jgi:cytochrome c peroxidase
MDPAGAAFHPVVFTLFTPWQNAWDGSARRAIAAGETIFNTRSLTISHVRGLNDNPAVAAALGTTLPVPAFQGTCTTCHNTPNVGNHSFPLPLDIGTSHDPANETDEPIAGALVQLDLPDVPVYEIDGCPNPFPDPRRPDAPYVIYTTDPGRALITGLCADVNRIKGPILRGLAARAPFFHNGAARDVRDVVSFYDRRFQMSLSEEEKSQLAAFLNSL